MRYDATEYLEAWQETGKFPRIHDAMASAFAAFATRDRLLDLCCCHGLLGARLSVQPPGLECVVGVDADLAAIERGRAAGVPIELHHMRITLETLKDLASLIDARKIDVLVARRAMPELWGQDTHEGIEFSRTMAAAGIREIFLEGRVKSARATNALASIDDEIGLFAHEYAVAKRHGAVAYLRRR